MTDTFPHRYRTVTDTFWFRAVGTATAFMIAGVTASSDDGLVLCPLRRCSGGYCPGCGLTRSTGHLLRGDLRASVASHPYLILLVAQLIAVVVLWTTASQAVKARLQAWSTRLALANVVVLLTIWVVRLAFGAIPIPFAG